MEIVNVRFGHIGTIIYKSEWCIDQPFKNTFQAALIFYISFVEKL